MHSSQTPAQPKTEKRNSFGIGISHNRVNVNASDHLRDLLLTAWKLFILRKSQFAPVVVFCFFKYRLIFCFSQGVYYQIGDVVSVIDEQDGKPYYAQIRGFVQDQYCEKSAALTWLIPTLASPRDQFDPASYIVGELDRDRQVLEPVYFPLLLETVFICSGRQDKIQ